MSNREACVNTVIQGLKNHRSFLWSVIVEFVPTSNNRIYIGFFDILMFPLVLISVLVYSVSFFVAPPVDIDGIREPVSGSILYGNNVITGALIPSSNAYRCSLLFSLDLL